MLAGLLVNGPYALITTAVSAELGVHPSLQGKFYFLRRKFIIPSKKIAGKDKD